MSSVYRGSSMMSMLDAKPEGQEERESGKYWSDVNDHLSPVRKHLLSTYIQVPEEEAMPLMGEYFGVALSFMALGALVRASNSTKRKQKRATEEERLDLRSCSRFQRMALESMLKEAMERLKTLAQSAYQLEEKVRDLVAQDVALDKEKVQLLKRVADMEKTVVELRGLRKAEGRANERVMCIVASKEQDWLKEKRGLQKEIQKLKETVNGMTREAKFQARRCRNPNCEHCKGIDRVVRSVKGRISLRELNSSREALAAAAAAAATAKRESAKVDRHLEVEEDRVLIKSIEHKKKQSEQPGHLKNQNKVEKGGDWHDSAGSSSRLSSAGGGGQPLLKESTAKQQQDMEAELANILKRVGMLKQRSHPSSTLSILKEESSMEEKKPLVEDKEVTELPTDQVVLSLPQLEEQIEVQEKSITPASNAHVSPMEEGYFSSDQEDYFSVEEEEDNDLVELEKAFESESGSNLVELDKVFESDDETMGPLKQKVEGRLISDDRADYVEVQLELEKPSEAVASADAAVSVADNRQQLLDEDAEFAAFERSLSSEEELGLSELGGGQELQKDKDLFHVAVEVVSEQPHELEELSVSDEVVEALEAEMEGPTRGNTDDETEIVKIETLRSVQDGQGVDSQELQTTTEATIEVQSSGKAVDGDGLQYYESLGECTSEEDGEGTFCCNEDTEETICNRDVEETVCNQDAEAKTSPEISPGLSLDHKQSLEEVELEDGPDSSDEVTQFSDVLSGEGSEYEDPSVDELDEEDRDHTEFGSDVIVPVSLNLQNLTTSIERGDVENQDIPVFERDSGDHSIAELPELEEKQVCGPEILDSNAAESVDELSNNMLDEGSNQGELVKLKETIQGEGGEQAENHFVEDAGLVTDEKVASDQASETCQDQEGLCLVTELAMEVKMSGD